MGAHTMHDGDAAEPPRELDVDEPTDQVPAVDPDTYLDYSAYAPITGHPDGYSAKPPTLFGREPAMLLHVLVAALSLASSTFLHLTVEQQGAVNAAISAILGLVVAIKVKGGTWVAALLALAQALIAVALAWKFHLAPDVQAGVLTLVAVVGGYATRQVVVAPQAPGLPGRSRVA